MERCRTKFITIHNFKAKGSFPWPVLRGVEVYGKEDSPTLGGKDGKD